MYATKSKLIDPRFTAPVLEHLAIPDIGEQRDHTPAQLWQKRIASCESLLKKLAIAVKGNGRIATISSGEWRGSWVDAVMVAALTKRRIVIVVPHTDGPQEGQYTRLQIYTTERLRQTSRSQATKSVYLRRFYDFDTGKPNPSDDIVLLHVNDRTHYRRILPLT